MAKQTEFIAGIYMRLSKDEIREGDSNSLSIENQRMILTSFCKERGITIFDEYIDDGYTGTDFSRPSVQRLLDDAKSGKINTIIVKDLSRFGREHIACDYYIQIIFPSSGIRFIAISDGVDTLDRNSTALEMLPVVNVFNEWHSATTSKKIKAVKRANAKAGKYRVNVAAYGYEKGTDEKQLPVIDEPAAKIVRRIFEERASGKSAHKIAFDLNAEKVPIPSDYHYAKLGKVNPRPTAHLWSATIIKQLIRNPIYLGHLCLLRTETISHKNHKSIQKSEDEWAVTLNTHEPIITQELWDKVREAEASVSRGKCNKLGFTMPLSGLMFCADCGEKMRLGWNNKRVSRTFTGEHINYHYQCGGYSRFGKNYCTSNYIRTENIDSLVLEDIRSMASLAVRDENALKRRFLAEKSQESERETREQTKKLRQAKNRLTELEKLIPSVYEDKVLGKIPENICVSLLEKYQNERETLSKEVAEIEAKLNEVSRAEFDADTFIRRLKQFVDFKELTREMCLQLIEYITVEKPDANGGERVIHIYYKLLSKPLKSKHRLDTAKLGKPLDEAG